MKTLAGLTQAQDGLLTVCPDGTAVIRSAASFLFCLIITGCASGPTVPATVLVPVATSCIKGEPPAKPALTDERALLAMSEYEATIRTWAERLELRAYAEKAQALLTGCK